MKFLAIEKDVEDVVFDASPELMKAEARFVLNLKKEGVVEAIYFNDDHQAVILFEAADMMTLKEIVSDFPLVKAGLIDFDMMALNRYTGFDRLK